jgi:hypothetical protein
MNPVAWLHNVSVDGVDVGEILAFCEELPPLSGYESVNAVPLYTRPTRVLTPEVLDELVRQR